MPEPRRPNRKRLGFFDARDRLMHLNNVYRTRPFGDRPLDRVSSQFVKDLAELETPEPDEELDGAELSDGEQRRAMAEEKFRRERKRP
jgi:hypothetical protein